MNDLLSLLGTSFRAAPVRYKGVHLESFYLPMSDGVRVAVDVMKPLTLTDTDRLPVVMVMTRYWRSFKLKFPPSPPKSAPISANMDLYNYLIARGIAVVSVDARGSGASFGEHPHPWSPRELADYGEVAQWAAGQPWCNGRIGATGFSYEGSTAQYLPASAPEVTRAILSQQLELDPFADVAFPGGIFNEAFIGAWSDSNQRQDNGKPAVFFPRLVRWLSDGVRRVDADKDGALLKQAIVDHQKNPLVYSAMDNITYRDDDYLRGVTVDDFSVYRRRADIEKSGSFLFNCGSWTDGCTAESALSRFNTFSNPQLTVIGAWSHDGSQNADPYAPKGAKPSPTVPEMREIQSRYFHSFLADTPSQTPKKRVLYYVMSAGDWRETEVWPPRGITVQRWGIGAGRSLSQNPAKTAGQDSYKVDFSATTGTNNRWHTELVKPVKYGNRANADSKLLTYTSAPLDHDLEIIGQPTLTVSLTSTHTDGAFYVYLEAVSPDGYVRYLTDGQLRLIHRKESDAPYWVEGVYHSCKRADATPFPIGQAESVRVSLRTTAVRIPRGERLRLAIAGHDADTFRRLPTTGTPTLTVDWSGTWLDVPVNG